MSARRVVMLALLVSGAATAGDFSIDSPLKDERAVIAGRLGASAGDVSARGLVVSGTRDAVPFSQGGGEVLLQGGLHFIETSFGGILGVAADLSLGGESSEKSEDGTVRDQRKPGGTAEEQAQTRVWVTSRFGLRAVLSLPIVLVNPRLAFRLGAAGGLLLEANGSRSFEFSPAFTAGAELAFVLGPVAGLASYLALPTQGEGPVATSHKLGLELGLGPIVLGATVQLDEVQLEASRGRPGALSTAQTFGAHVGYRFPAFEPR